MINFIEGRISVGAKDISITSDCDELNVLAEEGLIEKQEDGNRTGNSYYVEATCEGLRLGGFICLRERRIEWILLRWLDSVMKGWEDVSEKRMIDEYRLLSNFVKDKVGAPPNNKKTGTRTWYVKWGKIEVSYEVRSFDVAIFMTPRQNN